MITAGTVGVDASYMGAVATSTAIEVCHALTIVCGLSGQRSMGPLVKNVVLAQGGSRDSKMCIVLHARWRHVGTIRALYGKLKSGKKWKRGYFER